MKKVNLHRIRTLFLLLTIFLSISMPVMVSAHEVYNPNWHQVGKAWNGGCNHSDCFAANCRGTVYFTAITPATCTQNGSASFQCRCTAHPHGGAGICGQYGSGPLYATGHSSNRNYSDNGNGTHTAKCTTCGTGLSTEGHSMGGWITANSSSQYQQCSACGARNWRSIYTVVFNANGGTGTYSQTCVANTNYSFPVTGGPIKKYGYSIIAWTQNANGTGNSYSPGATFNNLTSIGNTTTVYAQWQANTYTLSINLNDGSSLPAYTKQVTFDEKYSFCEFKYKPTRTGYQFAGWYTAASGGTKVYDDNGQPTNTTYWNSSGAYCHEGNLTLYAHWTANDYSVSFDGNENTEGTMTDQSMKYDTASSLKRNTYKRVNKFTFDDSDTSSSTSYSGQVINDVVDFLGWDAEIKKFNQLHLNRFANELCLTENSSNNPDNVQIVTNESGKEVHASVQNPNIVNVTVSGSNITIVPKSKGQTTITFTTTGTDEYEETNTTYFVIVDPKDVTVSFYPMLPGKEDEYITRKEYYHDTYVSFPEVIRTGYSLSGWYTDPIDGTLVDANTIVPTDEDHNLYAHWVANNYTITLDNQGATTAGSTSVTATYDSSIPDITVPERVYTVTFDNGYNTETTTSDSTYVFDGYYTEKSGAGTKYYESDGTSDVIYKEANDITLYANWQKTAVTLPTLNRTNYVFKGWYTAAEGGTKVGDGGSEYTPESDVTLYAQWEDALKTFNVTWTFPCYYEPVSGAVLFRYPACSLNLSSYGISEIVSISPSSFTVTTSTGKWGVTGTATRYISVNGTTLSMPYCGNGSGYYSQPGSVTITVVGR